MSDDLPDAWLGDDPLPADPIAVVKRWLDEGFADPQQANPHAISLATVEPDGAPTVRIVLCTRIEDDGGFVFHSNRQSRKGRALAREPRAALAFLWPGRQVRVEGDVAPVDDGESDAYFASRPLTARLGAWASEQSEPIASRAVLLARLDELAERFSARREEDVVPRPPHWGGYRLRARSVELWASRPGRIHDRAVWTRTGDGWSSQRLQP